MQMDVRDMSYFADDSFDTVIDKGMFCGPITLFFVPLFCFLVESYKWSFVFFFQEPLIHWWYGILSFVSRIFVSMRF